MSSPPSPPPISITRADEDAMDLVPPRILFKRPLSTEPEEVLPESETISMADRQAKEDLMALRRRKPRFAKPEERPVTHWTLGILPNKRFSSDENASKRVDEMRRKTDGFITEARAALSAQFAKGPSETDLEWMEDDGTEAGGAELHRLDFQASAIWQTLEPRLRHHCEAFCVPAAYIEADHSRAELTTEVHGSEFLFLDRAGREAVTAMIDVRLTYGPLSSVTDEDYDIGDGTATVSQMTEFQGNRVWNNSTQKSEWTWTRMYRQQENVQGPPTSLSATGVAEQDTTSEKGASGAEPEASDMDPTILAIQKEIEALERQLSNR